MYQDEIVAPTLAPIETQLSVCAFVNFACLIVGSDHHVACHQSVLEVSYCARSISGVCTHVCAVPYYVNQYHCVETMYYKVLTTTLEFKALSFSHFYRNSYVGEILAM